MRFSEEFIERVRDSSSILDIIGQHVQLQKAGSSYRGLCPFVGHAEKTPSFFVSDSKQLYHCFGCKKSGTVFNFLMDFQGLTFPEAVESLAQRAHIPLPEKEINKTATVQKSRDDRALLLKVNKYVGVHFHKNLAAKTKDQPVNQYIQKRGLTEELISEFKLGYAEPGWGDLTTTLKKGKAPLPQAEQLGLIKKKSDNEHFDIFRDRLMFPILSVSGDVLGFGGRSLGDQQPKYLNSPESPVFHKGKTLYGLHVTAKYIRAQDEVYIVEGYMDLLALYQFGIKNVVATLGTAFTRDHATAIKKLCNRVVVLFDGDDAGQKAAEKSLLFLLDANLFSRHLILPDDADPDDFLRKYGAEEFKKRAKEASDHFLSFLHQKMADFGGRPTEKVAILNTVGPILDYVRDRRLRLLYLQELADCLSVSLQWVSQQMSPSQAQRIENKEEIKVFVNREKIPTEEAILVRFMLRKVTYLEQVRASLIVEQFMNPDVQGLAQRLIEKYCQNPNDFDKLAASLISQDAELNVPPEILTGHIANDIIMDEEGELQLFKDCIYRVKQRYLKLKSKSLVNSLRIEASSEKLGELLRVAQEQKGPKTI